MEHKYLNLAEAKLILSSFRQLEHCLDLTEYSQADPEAIGFLLENFQEGKYVFFGLARVDVPNALVISRIGAFSFTNLMHMSKGAADLLSESSHELYISEMPTLDASMASDFVN